MLAVAIAFGFGSFSEAEIIFQDFESGVVMPATDFFIHNGSGFLGPGDDLTAEGLSGSTAFAGAGGGSAGSASATFGLSATGGVGGSQAAQITFFNDGTTNFAFGGVQEFIGPVAVPTDFSVFADVLAPAGVPLSIRFESPFTSTNNGFALNFVGTGAFQTVGGVIGTDLTAIPGGTFDPNGGANLLIASPVNTNIAVTAAPFDVFIDNFSFAPTPPTAAVPEPGSCALLAALLPLIALRRRKSQVNKQ